MFLQRDSGNALRDELHLGPVRFLCEFYDTLPYRATAAVTGGWSASLDFTVDDASVLFAGGVMEMFAEYIDGLGNSHQLNGGSALASVSLASSFTVSHSDTYDPDDLGMEPKAWIRVWFKPQWGLNSGNGNRYPIDGAIFPDPTTQLTADNFTFTVS
jgi:hypothetical protein